MSQTEAQYRKAVKKRSTQGNSYKVSHIVTYEYWGKILKVVDGDTVDLEISLGFDAYIEKRCRLFGIDAPEYYSAKRDTAEKKAGKASKDWLTKRLPKNYWVEIRIFSDSPHDKYGRWLVEIFDENVNINIEIVKNNFATFNV